MMISFEVDARDLELIRLVHLQYYMSDAHPIGICSLLRCGINRINALEIAMRDIAKAVDADPATYKGTTLAMIRDIADKALGGEPTEA